MVDTEKPLVQKFKENIDSIASDFIGAFGLKHGSDVPHLSGPLLRWLDFRLRYVDPIPRKILISNKFPKQISEDISPALENLKSKILAGEDINPYQGKGLVQHHDTSGEKRQNRTDLLWADWGILHFHITNSPISNESYFSDRSKWLLFCYLHGEYCFFIDIRRHDEEDLFSNPELIEILIRNWPDVMERFRLKGILSPDSKDLPSAKEIDALRRGGVSTFVLVDGGVYVGPGRGVTSASTPGIVTQAMIEVTRRIKFLAERVEDPSEMYLSKMAELEITNPSFQLIITPRGMAVYESKSTIAFLPPERTQTQPTYPFTELADLVASPWAVNAVFTKKTIP